MDGPPSRLPVPCHRAGSVRINTAGTVDAAMPLGGYKQSGWGREMGGEVLHNYTEHKSVVAML